MTPSHVGTLMPFTWREESISSLQRTPSASLAAELSAVCQPMPPLICGRVRMRTIPVVGILLTIPLMAQEHPPRILEIYREPLKASSEATYRAVEEDAARICAELKFPHSHLAIESLTGPKEVWWLNGFECRGEGAGRA